MNALRGMGAGVVMLLSACASSPEPEPEPEISATDPDEGLVDVTYTIDPKQPFEPDWKRAREKALQQCRDWGHEEARTLGDQREECEATNRYRKCTLYYVSRTWQCQPSN